LLDPVDRLQFKMRNLRRKIKGWSWNINDERRKSKEKLWGGGLDELGRTKFLKDKIDHFLKIKEIKARQRARERDIKE
jgi:hypothetical protein